VWEKGIPIAMGVIDLVNTFVAPVDIARTLPHDPPAAYQMMAEYNTPGLEDIGFDDEEQEIPQEHSERMTQEPPKPSNDVESDLEELDNIEPTDQGVTPPTEDNPMGEFENIKNIDHEDITIEDDIEEPEPPQIDYSMEY